PVIRVCLIPVDALPTCLLTERRSVATVPLVRARDPQRPPRPPLVARVADVVVGLVHLARPLERVTRRAVVGTKPADVHLPHVERRLAAQDPLRHHAPDPAGPGETVGAEPRCNEEAADLGLAEAELVVRRERFGAV